MVHNVSKSNTFSCVSFPAILINLKPANLETNPSFRNRNARFRTGEEEPEETDEQIHDIPDVSDKEISQMISKVGGAAFLQLWKGIAQITQENRKRTKLSDNPK